MGWKNDENTWRANAADNKISEVFAVSLILKDEWMMLGESNKVNSMRAFYFDKMHEQPPTALQTR